MDKKKRSSAAYMSGIEKESLAAAPIAAMQTINVVTRSERMKQYRKRPGSLIMLLLVAASAVITIAALLLLIGYILISGVPNFRLSMFEW